ncbi:precorrin-3B synthase [Actinomycetospora straminea]|uniref:Precorrin-3B synthase n=1 Tax=Actinomycetospora straminea TaxID=663607 RepID=A0ABP9EGG7_9PSEU
MRARADACPGAWRRHDAADGALARFRPVGGAIAPAELRLLADASDTAADAAPLELTSRGSWQVRGLTVKGADDLAAALAAVGGPAPLLDDQGRDVPCSVVASPRSRAVDAPARAIADALRGRTDVPGRLLVAVDDGTGDVLGLDADVAVVLGTPARLHLAGAPTDIPAAGPTAGPTADPAGLALAAIEAFLAVRGDAWRVAEVGAAAVLGALRTREQKRVLEHAEVLTCAERTCVEVLPRLGEVTPAAARVLADLGDEGAALRVTPWRTVVLRDPPDDARERLAAHVETGPSRWASLSACVGAPRCAKSHTDVRGDLARAVATGRAGGLLHAHWVGCARACGTPAGPVAVVEGTPGGTYRTIVRTGRVSG